MEITRTIEKNYPYTLKVITEESTDIETYYLEKTLIGSDIEPIKIYEAIEKDEGALYSDSITRQGWLISQKGKYILVETKELDRIDRDFPDRTEKWWHAYTVDIMTNPSSSPIVEFFTEGTWDRQYKYSLEVLAGEKKEAQYFEDGYYEEAKAPQKLFVGSELEPIEVYTYKYEGFPYIYEGDKDTYTAEKTSGYVIKQKREYYFILARQVGDRYCKIEAPEDCRWEYDYWFEACKLNYLSDFSGEIKIEWGGIK